jgi:pSer/pThr/pTyr-binding forkhead associated (FHA) protein
MNFHNTLKRYVQSEKQANTINVISRIWPTSKYLYDYEASNIIEQKFHLKDTTKIFRVINQIEYISNDNSERNSEFLIRLVKCKDGFLFDKPLMTTKKLWMVIRDKYILSNGDIFKLGNRKFIVKKIICNESSDSIDFFSINSESTCLQSISNDHSCRICFLQGTTDDPLISPCNCRGSIEFVHVNCHRTWINTKLNVLSYTKDSYYYQQIKCEICNLMYIDYMTDDGINKIPIRNILLPKPPYIVLEELYKGIHVISLAEEKKFKIGRSKKCNMHLTDVTISRCHGIISFHEGNFIIEDNNSRFGTLVHIKNQMLIKNSKITVQIGSTVLELSHNQ